MATPPYPKAYQRLTSYADRWDACTIRDCKLTTTTVCSGCQCYGYCSAEHAELHGRQSHLRLCKAKQIYSLTTGIGLRLVPNLFISEEMTWIEGVVKEAYRVGIVASQPCTGTLHLDAEQLSTRSTRTPKRDELVKRWPPMMCVIRRTVPEAPGGFIYAASMEDKSPGSLAKIAASIYEVAEARGAGSDLLQLLHSITVAFPYLFDHVCAEEVLPMETGADLDPRDAMRVLTAH